jgi:hypothetical protein
VDTKQGAGIGESVVHVLNDLLRQFGGQSVRDISRGNDGVKSPPGNVVALNQVVSPIGQCAQRVLRGLVERPGPVPAGQNWWRHPARSLSEQDAVVAVGVPNVSEQFW